MKRKNLWKWGTIAAVFSVLSYSACADTTNVPVQAIDQDGNAVANAQFACDSGDKAVADEHGKAKLAIKKRALYNRFYASKEGYYPSQTHGDYSVMSKDFDPSSVIQIQLKQIKNPIAMYAKKIGYLRLPKYNGKKFGYDLVVGDWVAPYGSGKSADFIFKFEGLATNEPYGRLEHYDNKITIHFSNEGDGVIAYKGLSEAGRKYGSAFVSDYEAPLTGYLPEWVQRTWKEKGGNHQTTKNRDRNFYFRVRTKLDEKGNVISAHYGKIYGDFMSFVYYLNPTPNDRNVEFDSEKNLFPKEKVKRP